MLMSSLKPPANLRNQRRNFYYSNQPRTSSAARTANHQHKAVWLIFALLLCAVIAYIAVKFAQKPLSQPTAVTTTQLPVKPGVAKPGRAYDLTTPSSLTVIVNKSHPLNPKSYMPAALTVPNIPIRLDGGNPEMHLRPEAAAALETMAAAAKQSGLKLILESGYRSFTQQTSLYNYYVKVQGQATADLQSARPGYSEHQTGLAIDLGSTTQPSCNIALCFADTAEGKWLAANAFRYGFLLRYPPDKDSITGYQYEPWHFRYVGKDLSQVMHTKGSLTLEEYFKVTGGTVYR